MPDSTPELAMRRVADAILGGDYMTAMADVTPDALLQVMQIGGGMMNLPPPDGCDIEPATLTGGQHDFRITFRAGVQTLSATVSWAEVEGAWKIIGVSDVTMPG